VHIAQTDAVPSLHFRGAARILLKSDVLWIVCKIEIGPLTTAWQIWPNATRAGLGGPRTGPIPVKAPGSAAESGVFIWHPLVRLSGVAAGRARPLQPLERLFLRPAWNCEARRRGHPLLRSGQILARSDEDTACAGVMHRCGIGGSAKDRQQAQD